jgi:threonine dehydratase
VNAPELITLAEIEAARARIAPYVPVTPMVAMTVSGLRLKAESLTAIGAFKIRGAFNAILGLSAAERAAGVVAHSSGNHAQAVAFAAQALGVRAAVVMPGGAPAAKIAGVRRSGAEIVFVGPASAERAARAAELAAERGAVLIEPFNMAAIMAGTGTIGLEILEQAPDAEAVYAPVSGGGLLGGLASAIKLKSPGVKVIGVEPEAANDAAQSFAAGEIVAISAEAAASTMADGLRVQKLGSLTWPHIRAHVDEIVTVPEEALRAGMRAIAAEARLIAEPSGACAAAGALAHAPDRRRAVAVLSGGNVDARLFAEVLGQD